MTSSTIGGGGDVTYLSPLMGKCNIRELDRKILQSVMMAEDNRRALHHTKSRDQLFLEEAGS